MKSITLKSPSKINLTLDILGRDEKADKHFVNTILYRDDELFDEITLRKRLSGVKNILKCSNPDVPTDSSNTVLRALDILGETGWDISLTKNIPIQSGLGGGSSDAGVVLKYFGELRGLPEHEIQKLAAQVGADVPFFTLDDNLAYFEGFGDQFVQSWQIESLKIEYIDTAVVVSTPQAYAALDLSECGQDSIKTEAMLKLLNESKGSHPLKLTANSYKLFHNDFETSFFRLHPEWLEKGNLCGSGGCLWKF